MRSLGVALRDFISPKIPDEIRDEFTLFTAGQLQHQSRLLFMALLLTTPTAYFAASSGASIWIRVATPVAMALFCILGIWSLSRDRKIATSVRRSARLIRESTVTSSLIAVMCSAWCVYSWLGAVPDNRIYYPLIVSMGAFATAYCLSGARIAAVASIAISIAPMSVLLFTAGNRMDTAAGISLLVAAIFQLHMIVRHQNTIVDLLQLQRQSRELARTDPLTGLLNRRALLDHALTLGKEGPLRLIVADIDNFKAINDRHGHDMGDAVIIEVAGRLAASAEIRASVARIGGEEFALVGRAEDLPEALALAILTDVRTAGMPHGAQVTVSLGLADGAVCSETEWRRLFKRADAALYGAKRAGRNRLVQAAALAEPTQDRIAAA